MDSLTLFCNILMAGFLYLCLFRILRDDWREFKKSRTAKP